MSAGKRPRQQRQAPQTQPIIYEEESNGVPYPKRAARQAPEFDTCLEVVTEALSNPNRAMLRPCGRPCLQTNIIRRRTVTLK